MGERAKNARGALAVCAATLLCLAPFAGKAFNTDEPLFVWSAKHIIRHPLDPYGFSVNWYGVTAQMFDVTKNPPGGAYYLALAGGIAGWSEVALHLAMLIPAIAAILGTYLLASRLCGRPLDAALATLLTPVFLVSSTSVMCDTIMLALFVWALLIWHIGLEKNKQGYLALSALLIGVCALTKYYGVVLIGLVLLYTLVKKRRLGWWAAHLLITGAILAAYQLFTKHLYGQGMLPDAVSYATAARQHPANEYLVKGLIGLSFTGGCVAVVAFYAARLWSGKWLLAGASAVVAIIAALSRFGAIGTVPLESQGATDWALVAQLGLTIVVGIGVLALAVSDFLAHRDAESILLAVWVLGTYAFASYFNWSVNGRSILPMAPAVGILMMRRMERLGNSLGKRSVCLRVAPLLAAGILALAVTWSDFSWANSVRAAATQIGERYSGGSTTVWYQGHWGFQYYMDSMGLQAVDFEASDMRPGDVVVLPSNNTNVHALPDWAVDMRETVELGGGWGLTTMSAEAGAGFYCDDYGALPFALGANPPAIYRVYEVMSPLELRP